MSPVVLQGRSLVRAQPYGTQVTFIAEAIADTANLSASFDLAIVVTDPVQLGNGAFALDTIASVGPTLDVSVYMDAIGTVDVLVAIDAGLGAQAPSMFPAPLAVAANSLFVISGLRIPARFVNVVLTNTSGGAAVADFGCYVRSN